MLRESVAASGQKGTKTRFSGTGKEGIEFVEVSYALRKPYEIGVFRLVITFWASNERFKVQGNVRS